MIESTTLKSLPSELKFNGLFCGWKLTEKGKLPYNLQTGQLAKSNDSSTFSNYPVLLNNLHKYLKYDENGKQLGGFGLGIFRGYSAIDIDHCVDEDGVINEMATEIINFCHSYTEYSPSKTGIRIIFKTNSKIDKDEYYINNAKLGLEIYISDNTNKFVTLTGNKISGDSINEIDISYVLNKYMKKEAGKNKSEYKEVKYDKKVDLSAILEKDEKLKSLWNKTAPGSHADESETDMALCCKLAYYYHGDLERTNQAFMTSPYFASKDKLHKNKWSNGYGVNTIKDAIAYIGDSYNQVTIKKDLKFDLNDTGNARRFIEQFGSDVRYNLDNKIWMIWNGKFWQSDVQEYIKNYVEILAEKMLFETNNIGDVNERMRNLKNIEHIYNSAGKESLLKEARHIQGIPVMNDDFDRDEFLLCTNSGVVNLRTGEIQDYNKDDMISMTTGCEIDTKNKPERFIKFLEEMFDGNQNLIRYVHIALGYSITNSAAEQEMFILQGDGNNGKSLLLEIIRQALGSYAITSKPQLLTEQKYSSTNSEEIARLKGKRFIAVEETKEGDKLDEQLVKSLTSGVGNQVARFLYGNSFEFPVKGKIWMATNYEPVIRGVDKGIWRRIVKIPVHTDFTGREDKFLRDKLMKELPQILGWLLEGYKLYMKEGLVEPDEIKQATAEYKENMDLVQQWISEYCECKKEYYERANVLYDNYRAFCMRRDQRTNQTAFGRNLGKKFKKFNSGQGIVYMGIRLKQGATDIQKKILYENINVDENI